VGRPFVVACIPAFNEEKSIAGVIIQTMRHVDQIIVCDDGSSDMTATIAEKLGAVVLAHKYNLGYGASIASLFAKAREMQADIAVTIDSDGQHDPSYIQSLIQPIIDGQADIVIGSRFLDSQNAVQDQTSSYRKFGIKTITKISNAASQANLTDSQSGLRAYGKRAISSLFVTEQGMGASTEILMKALGLGLSVIEVPVSIRYAKGTSTHNSVYHGIDVLISTLKFVSIKHPLRFYGAPGLISIVLATIFGSWALQIYSLEGRLVTNVALLAVGFLMIGLLLLTTSVILYVVINVVRETRRV
jgi:glycosyltransferase involved in cell wall biosynthesis